MFAIPLIDSTFKKSGKKCRLALAREPISFFSPVSFGFVKNGPYTEAFNEKYNMDINFFCLHNKVFI